jgi:hypothetical protein
VGIVDPVLTGAVRVLKAIVDPPPAGGGRHLRYDPADVRPTGRVGRGATL